MSRYTYQMPDPQPWTAWDEISQRVGNVRRMLAFAWMAATTDSALFAVVFVNCARGVGDGLIAVTMQNGRRIDPEGLDAEDQTPQIR